MSAQIHERRLPFERPPRIRSMLTLAVASEVLKLAPDSNQSFTARLQMREQTQEFDAWYATIVAGDSPDIVAAVAAGETVLGIVPAEQLRSAPLDVRRVYSLDAGEIICSAQAPADFVTAVCKAIEDRKSTLGMPANADARNRLLERPDEAVPMHPVAETFWSGR